LLRSIAEEKERYNEEGIAEKGGFKPGMKE